VAGSARCLVENFLGQIQVTNSLENNTQNVISAQLELHKKISQGLRNFRERFDHWKAEQAAQQLEGKAKAYASDEDS